MKEEGFCTIIHAIVIPFNEYAYTHACTIFQTGYNIILYNAQLENKCLFCSKTNLQQVFSAVSVHYMYRQERMSRPSGGS